jgi:hypothetical protein
MWGSVDLSLKPKSGGSKHIFMQPRSMDNDQ